MGDPVKLYCTSFSAATCQESRNKIIDPQVPDILSKKSDLYHNLIYLRLNIRHVWWKLLFSWDNLFKYLVIFQLSSRPSHRPLVFKIFC